MQYGGYIGQVWPNDNSSWASSMTAIACVCLPTVGFAMAADGRSTRAGETAEIHGEEHQKIFDIQSPDLAIAYALTGTIFDDAKPFDLRVTAYEQGRRLSTANCVNYLDYVTQLCNVLKSELEKEMPPFPDNEDYDPSEKNLIARIILAGYFKRLPFACVSTFVHENGRIAETIIEPQPLQRMAPLVLGPPRITKLMFVENDPRFQNFRVAINHRSSMLDAVSCARGYIEACCSPEGRKEDRYCKRVGGKIHIATITPVFGFKWATPPQAFLLPLSAPENSN